MGIIGAMGLAGFMYYNLSIVPMKNKLEEQSKVIIAQDLRPKRSRTEGHDRGHSK